MMAERLDPNVLEAAELFAALGAETHASKHLFAVCHEVRLCWRELADVRPLLDRYDQYVARFRAADPLPPLCRTLLSFERWCACQFLYDYETSAATPNVSTIAQMEQVLLLTGEETS